MKIITAPAVYDYQAEKGLFITLDDFRSTPGLAKSLRRKVNRHLAKAINYRDYYIDLHNSGEATSRQCTAMESWKERAISLKSFDITLSEVEKLLDLK